MDPTQNLVFRNWRQASEHAQNLLNTGQINLDEYRQILARAEKEAQLPESASGRAVPVQSLPTYEQLMKYISELQGPRPAY